MPICPDCGADIVPVRCPSVKTELRHGPHVEMADPDCKAIWVCAAEYDVEVQDAQAQKPD